tara:strand:+ start:14516 stop:15424 length:909 start_codon:yes stop_codon:yes gene_type:complete
MKKILITGANGQLGRRLVKEFTRKLIKKESEFQIIAKNKEQFNLAEESICEKIIFDYEPEWVINAAAYTNVDKAEKEFDIAYKTNAEGPKYISKALLKTGGKLLHISTDYVFDGLQSYPYKTYSPRMPINAYGKTKEEGEKAIEDILISENRAKILRTSWLLGPEGNNFLTKMIQLIQNKNSLKIVEDQVSSPTTTKSLSRACLQIVFNEKYLNNNQNIMHWSDSGIASWYDVTKYIYKYCTSKKFFDSYCNIEPISSKDYPSPAKRPNFSKLDCTSTIESLGLKQTYWQESIEQAIEEIQI